MHWEQMTRQDAEEIAQWHYPAPYSFYDFAADPDDLEELLDVDRWRPASHFVSRDEAKRLMAFAIFDVDVVDDALMLGLGIRPDRTGQGLGAAFVREVLQLADSQCAGRAVHLAVAAFNKRAIRVYERVGFVPVRYFRQATNGGLHDFVEMMYPKHP